MSGSASFIGRMFGRSGEHHGEVGAPITAAPQSAPPKSAATPTPFGQFGEKGEKVGEHINYFLSRLDDVYSLRHEFASVAEPMQDFIRSHDQAQTRLAETTALLSRERTEAQTLRAELFSLRADHQKLDNGLVEANNRLKGHEAAAETRVTQLKALQIAHDDLAARLDWANRQLATETQTNQDHANARRAAAEDVSKLEQELALERARYAELKNLHEASAAETKRTQAQLERLQPNLAAARRRVSELETDVGNAAATLGALELKIAGEQEARRATDGARAQEKSAYEVDVAGLALQIEALESRNQVTSKLFDQTRTLLNEKIEEARLSDRAAKDLAAEKVTVERRHASAQDEIRRLMEQTALLGANHGDAQERCSMLTNALGAKEAQVEQLQSRVETMKHQLDDAATRYEQERQSIESVNRKLIEEVQSERAERALAQGALSIARGSREKLMSQIDEMKRDRFGRGPETADVVVRDDAGQTNITPFRAPELTTPDGT